MPLQNQRHELFAQSLANGQNASQAYRTAGYNDNRAAASRLQQDVRIKQRLAELMTERARRHDRASEKVVEKLALTRQWVLSRLVQNAEKALEKGDGSTANRALELIGKEQGMFIDRKETGGPGDFANAQSADEVLDIVRKEMGEEFANALAAVMGKQAAQYPPSEAEPTHDAGSAIN